MHTQKNLGENKFSAVAKQIKKNRLEHSEH